jgi:CarD family transcriptional regulator
MSEILFQIGDYVVCPGHGVGQVLDVESKDLGETSKEFYIVKVVSNGMKCMVPVSSQDGIRSLVTRKEIDSVFSLLNDHDVEVDTSTWNRRHRDYLGKLKTGSLLEIADVLRSLLLLKVSKKLSYGERQMLDQCKDLLVQEIALSLGNPENEVSQNIDSIFS